MASQEHASSRSSSPAGSWTFEEFMDSEVGREAFQNYLIQECGEEIAKKAIGFW